MKNGVTIFWAVIIIVIVGAVGLSFFVKSQPGKYDELAQCIEKQGVVFYGAFWCPHCQATKALFGASAKLLPYVECSTPNGQSQTKECQDKGITVYPTWERPDGTRITGEHTIENIAVFSGCTVDGQQIDYAPASSFDSGTSSAAQ